MADWAVTVSFAQSERAWIADGLLALLHSERDAPAFGWPINVYTHSLQTATRALRAGEDDALVVAALFHDATDMLDGADHAASAALLLEPHLDAGLIWLMKHHAIFQDAHFANLPARFSLARDAHRDHPMFERTAHFCSVYDQASFDPGYETLPIEMFEPIVRRVTAPRG